MTNLTERQRKIEEFIQVNIREHPRDIRKLTQEKFDLSKPAVMRYLNQLIEEKKLTVRGVTKNREYEPVPIVEKSKVYQLQDKLEESVIWKDFSDLFEGIKENVRRICQYGFTEMVNNAIEHSEGRRLLIITTLFFDEVEIIINDDGVGIFEKVKSKYNLEDPIHAILELSKGKLTTDPERHTGEGIFFTSRMFDTFFIKSKKIGFLHTKNGFDYVEQRERLDEGTSISLEISLASERTSQEVFDQFSTGEDFGFTKTIVPVRLTIYGDDQLISRSQARRLLSRFEKFKTVVLDFTNVDIIGQGFADEIFRVFTREHPNLSIRSINANKEVNKMIQHAIENRNESRGG